MDRLGIIVGMQSEARLARRLQPAAIEISGATLEGAKQAVERLSRASVDGIISFGFAAGLDPLLKPGTILIPHSIHVQGQDYTADHMLRLRLGAENSSVKVGALLQSDKIVVSSKEKLSLFQQTSCVAVDMESGIVARYCHAQNIPFAVLRVICDSAKRDLPPLACMALSQQGGLNINKMLGSIFSQPSQLSSLICLGAEATFAHWRLDRFLENFQTENYIYS